MKRIIVMMASVAVGAIPFWVIEGMGVAQAMTTVSISTTRTTPSDGHRTQRNPRGGASTVWLPLNLFRTDHNAAPRDSGLTTLSSSWSLTSGDDNTDDNDGSVDEFSGLDDDTTATTAVTTSTVPPDDDRVVDVAIIGAGIGGLVAGAILNTLYGKKVGVYESHYLPGGCAHAFTRMAYDKGMVPAVKDDWDDEINWGICWGCSEEKQVEKNTKQSSKPLSFLFDSGPTILLGCSEKPYNALRQVLDAVGQSVDWIRYDGWGMIENPTRGVNERRWKCQLGPDLFQHGPLLEFGGPDAVQEFETLRSVTKELVVGAAIPAMAMRPGASALIPLLRYFPTLVTLLQQGKQLTGTFGPYLDGPKFVVHNQWLRDWLDALAFSLSGLPASRTSAAAMAFVLDDMHREGAALDYPKGGLGSVIDALVRGVEQGDHQSKVQLRSHVERIDFTNDGSKATGVTLKNGVTIIAREGVICNAPIWTLQDLVRNAEALRKLSGNGNVLPNDDAATKIRRPTQTWVEGQDGYSLTLIRPDADVQKNENLLEECDRAEMTGSFIHLHIAINATGLDLEQMEAHYTVMDRGLSGNNGTVVNGIPDGPCGELNMIAVSNPCVIDPTLAPEGYMVLHAYGAANEPYDIWEGLDRSSLEYKKLKEERSKVLWRAFESVIPDVRQRVILELVGSPLTHERFLRRPRGTYGSATEDYLKDGSTSIGNLILAGDQIFPGIGVPAVAISGASAANGMVSPVQQWVCLDYLKGLGLV